MGLFGKLKDKVGIGSLKAEFQLAQPGFAPGEMISGNVVLHSASSDTKVTSVLVQLVNFGSDVEITEVVTDDYYYGTTSDTYENKFKFNETVFESYLAQDFVVTTGQRLELPFEIGTTPDAAPTDKFNGYMLKVHVDIPGKIDTKAAKPVHILNEGGGAAAGAPMGAPMGGGGGDLPMPGERVLAYWAEDDAWYEATVNGADYNGVQVTYDDGYNGMLPLDQVLPSASAMPGPADLGPGMRVMARYEEGFYEAGVASVSGAQVMINWDDGTQTWVSIGDIRLL